MGYNATLGVAPTPLAARLFARAEAQGRSVRGCVALAELRERVAELPLFLLDWPAPVLARLTDLGLLRVRDAVALPAEGLARRFGAGVALGLDGCSGAWRRACHARLPALPRASGAADVEASRRCCSR
jgi:protein ImuB